MSLKKMKNEIKKSFNLKLIIFLILTISSAILFTFYKNKPEEKLKCWPIILNNFGSYVPSLRSMNRVFARMNYEFVNASVGDDWDILWSHELPWRTKFLNHSTFLPLHEKIIQKHQKINHFPGIISLIAKNYMNQINKNLPFILPSFILPNQQDELDKFLSENPHKKLLEKNVKNRGVKIVNVKEVNSKNDEVFYQEFMDNPFLIDGHAFDFGIYVLITSFDPLRVYRFNEEVLLRFCSEKYHPFDPQNRNKYVVKDGSIPVYKMPSFEDLYKNYSYSSIVMFENLISQNGFDVKDFWKRIDNAIAKIVINSEFSVIENLLNYNISSHHFFELVRFDIILDAELNPFVVEVNLSPNLSPPDERYEENSLIYEQLIHNVVKMIGGGSYHEFFSRFDPTSTIVSNRKNLATSLTKCLKYDCINNCNRTYCQMCHPCMTDEVRYQLSEAFREHQHAANFKRVFPVSDHFNDEKFIQSKTRKNQIQMRWWKGKCEDDMRWC